MMIQKENRKKMLKIIARILHAYFRERKLYKLCESLCLLL